MGADGRVAWLRDTVRLMPGPGGGLEARGVTQDVSAQKLAEAEREATLRMQANFVSFASPPVAHPADRHLVDAGDGRTRGGRAARRR